jgi:putative FmdB family regulatory protein
MPLYEYKCPQGHVFELFHGIADPAPETCPTCDAGPVVRVLYPVAVHFKGSGFYSTDYGRGNRKPSKDGDKPATTEGGASETKPDVAKTAEA